MSEGAAHDRALEPGSTLLWYVVERMLGRGGFGITYLARDPNLDRQVAIKEYLPTAFAYRHPGQSVRPLTEAHRDDFAWGLARFIDEAKTLARFDHPHIVRVQSAFEANDTAYMVMEYEEGESLAALFDATAANTEALLRSIVFPIFRGLEQMHRIGFIHRDIKPANIYVRSDGTPVLLDFGSARPTLRGDMTRLVTPCYAPLEQYNDQHGLQGPWSDIYSLAASLYQGVAGRRPNDALDRAAAVFSRRVDPLSTLDAGEYPHYSGEFLAAIMSGLALQPENRPQTIADWTLEFNPAEAATLPRPVAGKVDIGSLRQGEAAGTPATATTVARTHEQATAEPRTGVDEHAPVAASVPDVTHPGDATTVLHPAPGQRGSRPRSRWLPFGAASLALLLVTVTYLSRRPASVCEHIDGRCLASLPAPAEPMDIELPVERLDGELDDLRQLATLYMRLAQIDVSEPTLTSGLEDARSDLADIAERWNTGRHGEVRERVEDILQRMPFSDLQRASIDAAESTASPTESDVVALLNAGHIASPEGGSLLDSVPRIDQRTYTALTANPAWRAMLDGLERTAVERIADSDFDEAARVIELGLSLQMEHAGLQRLRDHLSATERAARAGEEGFDLSGTASG